MNLLLSYVAPFDCLPIYKADLAASRTYPFVVKCAKKNENRLTNTKVMSKTFLNREFSIKKKKKKIASKETNYFPGFF